MPNTTDSIKSFVCGNDFAVERMIDNITSGLTMTAATLEIQREFSDATPLVTKTISTALSGQGQITNNNDLTALVRFVLAASDTTALTEPHWFEIKVTLSNGRKYTTNQGVIRGSSTLISPA